MIGSTRLPLFLVLAGLLGACAETPGPQVCSITQVAQLPTEPGRHLVVPGRLNQGDATFVLDTGAEASSVTPDAARHNNLAHGRATARIQGLGGILTAPTVFANVELGGVEVRRQLPVAELPMRQGSTPLSGLLGADMLDDYDLEISLPEHLVRLWRVSGCAGDYVRWTGRHWSVPLQRTTRWRLLLPVTVDGAKLTGMLDTGADGTLMTEDAARKAGAANLAADPLSHSRGADGSVVEHHRHKFQAVTIGPETFRDVGIAVMAGKLSAGEMLLGMDWLRQRRIWVSWSNREVFIQPAKMIPHGG